MNSRRLTRPNQHPSGFTLIELMVSAVLISLLMVLFAQVFQIASTTMQTQRGIAENDQRARSVVTLLRQDLKYRTFKSVVPFQTNEDVSRSQPARADIGNRRGYFSISENDPRNEADDVLQFTVQVDQEDIPFYGHAETVGAFNTEQNQPEWDDADASENKRGASQAAEVVYFVRNGILYRRTMLLRQPQTNQSIITYDQPQVSGGTTFFDPMHGYYPGADGPFWKDFDYSARFRDRNLAVNNTSGLLFNGVSSLTLASSGDTDAIANPYNRFGHTHFIAAGVNPPCGRPKEWMGNLFLGGYTHEETSHPAFRYPFQAATVGTGNPMEDTTLSDSTPADGVIDEFAGGPRRGTDIVLTGVQSFNVEVWDDSLGEFINLGDSRQATVNPAFSSSDPEFPNATQVPSDYSAARNRQPTYGSHPHGLNNIFDTWAPGFDYRDDTSDLLQPPEDSPPFRPLASDTNAAYRNPTTWAANTTYNPGDIVVPIGATAPYDVVYVYQDTTMSYQSGGTQPLFGSAALGTADQPNAGAIITDGAVTWRGVWLPKPLRAIRITIKFYDAPSTQMRQVSLVQSLSF